MITKLIGITWQNSIKIIRFLRNKYRKSVIVSSHFELSGKSMNIYYIIYIYTFIIFWTIMYNDEIKNMYGVT